MRIKRIHVNQHNIRANTKNDNQSLPVFTIKTSGKNIKANSVEILGHSTLVYSTNKPLSCGAKVWIETKALLRFESVDGNSGAIL